MIALGIPLAVNLQRRSVAELETQAIVRAQAIASFIGAENVQRGLREDLQRIVDDAADQVQGRVIVVDLAGTLVADSAGTDLVGTRYATAGRPEIVTTLQTEQPTSEIRLSEDLGQDIMATAVPIRDEERFVGVVRITQDIEQVRSNVRRTTVGLVVVGIAGLAAGLLLAFMLADSLARPLTQLAASARRLGHGELETRAEGVEGAREIRELATSFDEMADRLERTVRAQREFVANASHQLRTPLTGMKLRLESAVADAPNDEVRAQLAAAEREVDRLSAIVDRLLVMAREIESGEPVHVSVGEAVQRALDRWRERAEAAGATLRASGDGAEAQANPTDLDQILDNLIDNALAYAPGPIEIEATDGGDHVLLAVRDHGPGIPAADRDRVTERFYRGRGTSAAGSGLGLAIVRELAEKWGGSVTVEGPDDGGTRVAVRLRRVAADRPDQLGADTETTRSDRADRP